MSNNDISDQQVQKELKYNFVFFFVQHSMFVATLGKEVYNHPQVHVFSGGFDGNRLLKKLFHYHMAYRVNTCINLPFKSIWFKRMYEQNFDNDLPFCFVFVGGNMVRFEGGFIEYARKRDPRNKIVMLHWDLISKKINYDYDIIRRKVDLAVTYDKAEAEKYGIHYFREDTYSRIVELPKINDFDSDVYFLASVKDRLPEILAVYKQLTSNGVKCKFILVGVKPKDQYYAPGIEYSNEISYEENIRNVIRTKCVLEIIQKGSVDITTRPLEAMAYQRRLLSNCQTIPDEFFNEGQLQVFRNPEEIDVSFIKAPFDQEKYKLRYDLNPLRRLYDIQEQLEKQHDNV